MLWLPRGASRALRAELFHPHTGGDAVVTAVCHLLLLDDMKVAVDQARQQHLPGAVDDCCSAGGVTTDDISVNDHGGRALETTTIEKFHARDGSLLHWCGVADVETVAEGMEVLGDEPV